MDRLPPRRRRAAASRRGGLTLRLSVFAPLARFWYLALTPAFALLAWTTGFDLRVSLLDGFPHLRVAYYVASFLCGLGATLRPGAARAIARVESTANLAMLVIGVALAYGTVLDSAAGPGEVVNPFTPESVANLALSAGWAYVSWVRVSAAP